MNYWSSSLLIHGAAGFITSWPSLPRYSRKKSTFTRGITEEVSSQADKLACKHMTELEQTCFCPFRRFQKHSPSFTLSSLSLFIAHPIKFIAVSQTFSLKSALFLETQPNQRDVFLVSRLPFFALIQALLRRIKLGLLAEDVSEAM